MNKYFTVKQPKIKITMSKTNMAKLTISKVKWPN